MSKMPQAWAVWAATAIELTRMGYRWHGILVLIMVGGYLRPSEALQLTCGQLLPPTN